MAAMDYADMLELIQAARDGKTIQCFDNGHWKDLVHPCFDHKPLRQPGTGEPNYRVKPERQKPKEIWDMLIPKWSQRWNGPESFYWSVYLDLAVGGIWLNLYQQKKTKSFSYQSGIGNKDLKAKSIKAAKEEVKDLLIKAVQNLAKQVVKL